ncbi:hypothetical protein EVAR_43088_1 [Eumeta japonica]|uniref:Uncharacterized protein n=1 Tax=Eumeta variegata TaxID=151549 RepID=A0A4C1WWP8_EUMVA|nr:hypothetical protein EVAR_43088_1 [Eumeta japonica]
MDNSSVKICPALSLAIARANTRILCEGQERLKVVAFIRNLWIHLYCSHYRPALGDCGHPSVMTHRPQDSCLATDAVTERTYDDDKAQNARVVGSESSATMLGDSKNKAGGSHEQSTVAHVII